MSQLQEFTFTPDIRQGNAVNQIMLSDRELNYIQRKRYADTSGFWQSLFGLYSYMTLNSNRRFKITTIKGSAGLWNKWESCHYYLPNGGLTRSTKDLEPCSMYSLQKWCHDDLLESCLEHTIQFNANGTQGLSQEGSDFFSLFVKELMVNATQGLRNTVTIGKAHNFDEIGFSDSLTMEEQLAIKDTENGCKGWLRLLADMAEAGHPWLNCPGIIGKDDFSETCLYQGDVLDTIEALTCKAPAPLRRLINAGGVSITGGNQMRALLVVSYSYFNAISQEYKKQCEGLMQNCTRITRESMTSNGYTSLVYYVDNMPVVPVEELACLDDKINADTHFIGIIASGNINIGTNFGAINDRSVEEDNIAVLIQQNLQVQPNMKKIGKEAAQAYSYGEWTMLSHALTQTAIVDPDYAVAAQSLTSRQTK